jgi:hypothetical protein
VSSLKPTVVLVPKLAKYGMYENSKTSFSEFIDKADTISLGENAFHIISK